MGNTMNAATQRYIKSSMLASHIFKIFGIVKI